MKKNKALLSIILIIVILLVAGASIFIASRLSTQSGIAPNAPASVPKACADECPRSDGALVNCTGAADGTNISLCNAAGRVEICGGKSYTCPAPGGAWALTAATTATPSAAWAGSTACTVSATSLCVASGTITCTPDCPTACGSAASTISSCTDSCGVAKTKVCAATSACADKITLTKKSYKNESSDTPASYTEINSVAKNQTFIYAILIENKDTVSATGVNITDTLNGEHQDILTFVSAQTGCTYAATDKKITCANVTIPAGQTKQFNIRVKVGEGAVNGDIIKNTVVAAVSGTDITATNEVTVSTIVACNHTCTTDTECGTGLTCDTTTSKCRNATCASEDTCSCPVTRVIVTATPAPTRVVTAAPGVDIVEVAQPTVLPETGILDFPGVAAFGGGLLLAVVGILLAL